MVFIKKEIKIFLHAPLEKNEIAYLNDVHNEMIVAIVRKRLQESGLIKSGKKEYIEELAEMFGVIE